MRPRLKNKSDRYTENRSKYANETVKVTIGGEPRYNADMALYATVVMDDTSLIENRTDNNYLKFWSADDKIEDTLTVELGKVPNNIERIMVMIAPDSEFSKLWDIRGYWIVESDLLEKNKRHEFYDYVNENTKEILVAEIIFNKNGTINIKTSK